MNLFNIKLLSLTSVFAIGLTFTPNAVADEKTDLEFYQFLKNRKINKVDDCDKIKFKEFLKKGANINAKIEGKTIFSYLLFDLENDKEFYKDQSPGQANVLNDRDIYYKNKLFVIDELLEHGADPTIEDRSGVNSIELLNKVEEKNLLKNSVENLEKLKIIKSKINSISKLSEDEKSALLAKKKLAKILELNSEKSISEKLCKDQSLNKDIELAEQKVKQVPTNETNEKSDNKNVTKEKIRYGQGSFEEDSQNVIYTF